MYNLKAFIEAPRLIDNKPSLVSRIGELSTLAKTYSKEVGYYRDTKYPDVQLVSFTSVDTAGAAIRVPGDVLDQVLKISQWVLTQATTKDTVLTKEEYSAALQAQFASEITGVVAGEIITQEINAVRYEIPSVLSWSNALGEGSKIKIWFATETFESQYDLFDITVIEPLTPIDNFFRSPSQVALDLSLITPILTAEKVQNFRAGKSETMLKSIRFYWVNPFNKEQKLETYWHVLIYSKAGDNIDAIKSAIQRHILSKSAKPIEDWKVIFPDIFLRTEFTLLPLWHQYSVPSRTLKSGVYSPIVPLKKALALMLAHCADYPDVHVQSHTEVLGFPHASIAMLSCSSSENREGIYSLTQSVSDYMDMPTNSLDFNRMSASTKDWVMKIDQMLKTAAEMDEYSDLPQGYNRLIRGDKLYITCSHEDIYYLVSAKKNTDKL